MWSVTPGDRDTASRNNMIQRVFTSALGLPLVLALILLGDPRIVALIFNLLLARTTIELTRLALYQESQVFYSWVAVGISALAFLGISRAQIDHLRVLTAAILVSMIIGAFGRGTIVQRANRCTGMALGVFYPLVTWVSIWELYLHSPLLPLYVLSVSWGSDTAAFIGGRRFGHRKLLPVISPKKTLEGAVFGFVGGVVVVLVIRGLAGSALNIWDHFLLVSPVAAICAQGGDALKSIFKRAAGVKDAGKLLPGHGGLLDRIDSVLLVSVFVWLLLPLLS